MSKNRGITLMRPSQIFDTFMDEFFNSPSTSWSNASSAQINLSEDDNSVFVEVNAPGFTKDNLDINIEGETLTVSGRVEEKKEEENKDKKYYIKEITSSAFERMVTLPSSVDASKANAKVESGIIKISIPKRPESKPQKITISAE